MAEFDLLRLDRGVIEGDVVRVNSALLIGASPDGDRNAGKKPIHFAVENDSIQIVELLCEWGAKVNVPNPEEQDGSPLHMAVKKGFTSVVKCLLEKNADPNVKDGEGDTPLITAIRKGEISSAGLLLKYGADLKKRDKIHDSALHIAVKKNNGEIVQMLLKEGASVNNINMQGDFTIHVAARNASEWILETLKEKRCDINQRHRDGSSPLHLAAESGNLEAVKWLLRNGAKLDDLDAGGKTPTDRAADAKKTHVVDWIKDFKVYGGTSGGVVPPKSTTTITINVESEILKASLEGNVERVRRLIQRNTDLEVTDKKGQRPLHLAALGGHDAVVKELLSGGADVAAKGLEGLSAIHYAAKGGHVSTLFALLESKCDIEALTEDGSTALHLAALNGHSTVVEWLVKQARSKVTLANKKRETALDLARKAGKEDMIQFLVKECTKEALKSGDVEVLRDLARKGVDVDAVGFRKGLRPAHTAAMYGHINLLKNLREIRCDVKAETDKGLTALHFAANFNHLEAVRWLVEEAGLEVSHRSKDSHTALDYAEGRRYEDITTYLKQVIQKKGARKVESGEAEGNRMTETGAVARGTVARAGTAAVARGTGAETAATGGTAAVARGTGAVARTGAGTAAADAARGTGAAAGAETAAVGRRPAETARNGIGAETGGQGVTMELRTLEEYRNCVDRAMASDDFKSLIELMEKGIDVDTLIYESNDQGIRAVHYAAKNGEMEMLETLKDKNFDLKALTRKGFTALHCAVLTGQLDAVQWLVSEAGLDVASPSKGGETALDLANVLNRDDIGNYLMQIQGQKAFQEDDVNAMRALLGKGFNVNTILREKENKECRPLHLAADRGHTTIVNILLQNEADINTKNYEGMTPLHLASLAGNEEVIKALVEKGADWNTETTDGMMAIHLASIGGHVSAMEALAPVCDIASVTRDGKSALHLAAEHGNLAAVQWLTRKGLDLSLKDHSGRTSLQYAKNEGQKKVVEFLENFEKYHSPQNLTQAVTSGDVDAVRKILLYKVDLERPSHLNQENDRRVLHTAALFGHVDIIRELLKAGAAKDARDRMGLQAVHYAAKGGNIEALKLLKECQCDLTTRTIKGDMVLHYATEGGHLAAVQWLCEHAGLGLNTLNNSGETALDVARRKGDVNTALYLQNAKHQRELQELQNELKNKDAEIAELKRKM